jgi:hypothetical protein
MKWLTLFFVASLCIAPAVSKPKPVSLVYVKMVQGHGTGFIISSDSRSTGIDVNSGEKVTLNVIVTGRTTEYAAAVAQNDGKWCLVGNAELRAMFPYEGLLQGDGIDVLLPQPDGKTGKAHFSILYHRWIDLSRL